MNILPNDIPWTRGNQLQVLNSGKAFFPALIDAIGHAQHDIFLETYIFADDVAGQNIIRALIAASERGVKVHVLVDGFGARNFVADFGEMLQAAKVRYLVYRPETGLLKGFRRNRLRRLHRKLAVIDRAVALVGGINLIDDFNAPPHLAPRVDFAAMTTGPIAQQIHREALREWTLVARSGFQAHLQHWTREWLREYRQLRQSLFSSASESLDTGQVRFLPRDNTRHRQTIANAYLNAFDTAQQSILLAHAYFLPGFKLRQALRKAAQRGVKVTILLQGSSDHRLLKYATRALYTSLLQEGITLYEYTASFLHAKVGVVDGHWATIGSSNMDPFSLWLAHEGNLEVRDAPFADQLTDQIQTLIAQGAEQMSLMRLQAAPLWSRATRWLAYGCVRLLIAIAGYGANRGMR